MTRSPHQTAAETAQIDRTSSVYDSFDSIPDYDALRDAVHDGDWPLVEAALTELPAEEASFAIGSLAEVDGIEAFLTEAVEIHPRSAFARTALAMRHVVMGWAVRTGAPAEDVSREQFAEFREQVVRAERLLIDVCAEHRDHAPAWVARVLTARALEVGPSEARRRYDKAVARSPHDFVAHVHYLQYVSPKWFGSVSEAADFARSAAAAAPAGSNSAALVALHHLEQWHALGGLKPGTAYLRKPEVLRELTDAAQRSVLHPQHRQGPAGIQAHSAFAMVFWLAERNELAAVHLRALDGRASAFPWEYAFDDPARLDAVRAEVLDANHGKDAA